MKDTLEVIVKSLVEFKDKAYVTESEEEKGLLLKIHVSESDVGRIIGKQGRTIKAIRTLMKVAVAESKKKFSIEVDR